MCFSQSGKRENKGFLRWVKNKKTVVQREDTALFYEAAVGNYRCLAGQDFKAIFMFCRNTFDP